jgi:hypothetical protein
MFKLYVLVFFSYPFLYRNFSPNSKRSLNQKTLLFHGYPYYCDALGEHKPILSHIWIACLQITQTNNILHVYFSALAKQRRKPIRCLQGLSASCFHVVLAARSIPSVQTHTFGPAPHFSPLICPSQPHGPYNSYCVLISSINIYSIYKKNPVNTMINTFKIIYK